MVAVVLGAAALLTASARLEPAPAEAALLPRPVTSPVFDDLRPISLELRRRIEALRRFDAGTSSPHPGRNPLASSQRDFPETAEPSPREESGAPEQPLTAAPPAPELVLVGIAETRDGDALLRTAIITGTGDEVHLVGERDALLGLYAVRVIDPGAVLLEDNRGGVRRLTLAGVSAVGTLGVE